MTSLTLPQRKINWTKAARVIPSREPTVELYARISDPKDYEALYALEALTNPRLQERPPSNVLPKSEWLLGEGMSIVMAPLVHINPNRSRFSDGTFGVLYAGKTLNEAIAETSYHRANFMGATKEQAQLLTMRSYQLHMKGLVRDIREKKTVYKPFYHTSDYVPSGELGAELFEAGDKAIAYRSVRHQGGENIAIFRPKALVRSCIQTVHLQYHWDGKEISKVEEIRERK